MFGRLLGALRGTPETPASKVVVARTAVKAAIFDRSLNVVQVVGESHRQDVLERLAGGRGTEGVERPDHLAGVLAEPSNPVDRDAVQVQIDAELVGYLARPDARAYRPIVDRLATQGLSFGCHARLTGGWARGDGDSGSIGVRLLVGTPAELWREIDAIFGEEPMPAAIAPDVPRVPLALPIVGVPAHLQGKSVCFTGPSLFMFQGAEVSRGMQELLAVQYELRVLPRVTKKLDILVVGRLDVDTGKTTKAAAYGTVLVDEAAFWTALGVTFDLAAGGPPTEAGWEAGQND